MRFSTLLKAFEYSILNQGGVSITPEQLGLKVKNPNFPGTGSSTGLSGGFSSILNQAQNGLASGALPTAPTPPTPPADPTNATEQAKFQQELVTYNQNFQTYHLRTMQLMSQRFEMMLQNIQRTQQQAQTSKSATALDQSNSGVGGILDTDDVASASI